MAPGDPVRVVVEIIDQFSDELAELEAKLEKLDLEEVDIDADIDDDGDIEGMRAQVKALKEWAEAQDIDLEFDASEGDVAKILSLREAMGSDIEADVHFDTDAESAFMSSIQQTINDSQDLHGPERPLGFGDTDTISKLGERSGGGFGDFLAQERLDLGDFFDDRGRFSGTAGSMGLDMPWLDPDIPIDPDRGGSNEGAIRSLRKALDDTESALMRFGRRIGGVLPDMSTWYNIVALLIPAIATLGVAAVGLAGAFVGVGVAAAGIAGVGLLGWGDSMQESFQNLQREAKLLQERLFGVLQPAAQEFQPILEGWMEGAPRQVQRLVDEMQALTVFADEISALGVGLVGFIEEGLQLLVQMEPMITQLVGRFSQLAGNALLSFFEGLTKEVYAHQDAYISMAEIFGEVLMSLYNVFRAVSFVVAQFGFLTDILLTLTSLLNNEWAVAFGTAVAMVGVLSASVLGLARAWTLATAASAAFSGSLTSYVIPTLIATVERIQAMIASLTGLNLGFAATAALTGGVLLGGAALGAGVLLGGFGEGAPGGGGGGGTQVNNMQVNIEGNVGRREADRIIDRMPRAARNEMRAEEMMQ
jgi:hypothetical protein